MHVAKRRKKITATGGAGKAIVLGILERKGRIRAKVIRDVRRKTIQPEVKAAVAPGTALYTDAAAAYVGLNGEYVHQTVDHAVAYVRDRVHTNGLENFWSLLKRGLNGTYIAVSPWHLSRYIDEQAFRYNERKATDAEPFGLVLSTVLGRRLTYSALVGPEG